MPLGNPITQNIDTRIVSSTATVGQTSFTITGGYTINNLSVYRNGVRLSNADDFTAADGSTVSLNVAADVGDRLDFHVFDKFSVANAIVGAASTQTISGNLALTGELYVDDFIPAQLNVTGVSTLTGNAYVGSAITMYASAGIVSATSFYGSGANLTGIDATTVQDSNGVTRLSGTTSGVVISGTTSGSSVVGVATFQNGLDVTGNITNGLNVSAGIATFQNGLDVTGNITNGLNVSAGIATFAGAIDVNSTTNFADDVVFDGATAGRDITYDRSADNLIFNDNAKAAFGDGNDLQIYHDGTDSLVKNATNDLILQSTGDDVVIKGNDDVLIYVQGGAEAAITCRNNAEVDLRYDGNVKLATAGGGVTVTGTCTATAFSGDGSSLTNLPASSLGSDARDNTIAGAYAGANLNSSSSLANSLFGKTAGNAVTTAQYNTAVGFAALVGDGSNNVTGGSNVAIGAHALRDTTSGQKNVAVGRNAGLSMESAIECTFLGHEAGNAVTTGNYNTCVGAFAGHDITTGTNNTTVGTYSLDANTTGANNTALGYNALGANTTGTKNTAIGEDALDSNTTGYDNVAVGYAALKDGTSNNNVAVGAYAATDVTSGDKNVAIGYEANKVNASGSSNVVVGHSAMKTTTASNQCVAVGYEALMTEDGGNSSTAVGALALRLATQHGNTAVGHGAMTSATTAWDCTAVGKSALSGCLDSQENTAVGNNAIVADCGAKNTAVGHLAGTAITGNENTCVGVRAGTQITSGNSNTCLGEYAGKWLTTGSDNIFIGRDCHSSSAEVGTIVVGATLGSKGSAKAYIGGSSGAYNEQNYSTWATTSDRRIKKNITNNTTGLDKINQITVRNFEYKTEEEIIADSSELKDSVDAAICKKTGTQVGVIAQELETILPELVNTDPDHGIKSVNADNLTWYLVNAVKELSTKNDELVATNTALAARITALES